VHVLAADGGLDDNGAWVKPRRSHFLPARVLMLLFRGKLLAMLREELERGRLRLPADLSRERAMTMFNHLGRKKWNVHIRARYAHGEGVAAYLARYLKGGALKNTQLVAADATTVRFRYTAHRDEDEGSTAPVLMTLSPQAFLERYLTHIAPPRLQCVRGYGLYGQRQRATLDQARAALGQIPFQEPQPLSTSGALAKRLKPRAARAAARYCYSPRHWPMAPLRLRACTELARLRMRALAAERSRALLSMPAFSSITHRIDPPHPETAPRIAPPAPPAAPVAR
jgi:hypothetical protein